MINNTIDKSFKTPILFLIFNRPDTTKIVFDQIKKAKPKYLFVAADGPRNNIIGEYEKCMEARKVIDDIDWNCEVKTLFRNKNLGCGKGISFAISWFFDNVEEGIILEDDCVPDLSFFDFCVYCLNKYRYEEKVVMISGTSYLFNKIRRKESYFFSRCYAIWGWATWKRVWELYDFKINDWESCKDEKKEWLYKIFKNHQVVKFWENNFDAIVNNKVDTWDYQWSYMCLFNDGLCLTPFNNFVSNIGDIGAHAKGSSPFLRMPVKPIDFENFIEPSYLKENKELTKLIYENIGVIKPFSFSYFFSKRFLIRIYSSLRKFFVIRYMVSFVNFFIKKF